MDIEEQDIKIFQEAISESSGYDFSDYSINSLRRRLTKVLKEFKSDFDVLLKKIRNDPEFLESVMKLITVNTTELFRDPVVWRKMLYQVLPRFSYLSEINIWHPGCSTGQEVYSMMILLDHIGLLEKSNIYASDINADVLETAEKGNYRYRFNKEYITNYNEVFSVIETETRRQEKANWKKYFKIDETRDLIIMQDYLRKKPAYKKVDLVTDGNLFQKKFDLIVCRNVIIYFNYELQNRILKMFHDNMQVNSCLLLGLHESIIGPYTNLFAKDEQFYFKRRSPGEGY